jgi:tRNA A-37 threonylcarbamoyl transferase component Bud32/tetratricopeptide (TPR) repeat protein
LANVPDRLSSALSESYRIERELGAGGMATVYLAQDLKHQRRVALKVLHPELAHALGPERFRREIEIAARLAHPHILTVFDSGDADGMLWYTMPFVEGESLRHRLEREHELSLEDALQITREVADALDYAHGQGVVHRDIKPENILLSRGHALVADFGIARAMQEETGKLTATGLAIGTPAYMSPEQADGERQIGPRSDVYSLASVSYEMLSGEPPYSGSSARAVLTKRLTDPIPSPRRLRQAIPHGMDQAIMRALAPTPADRFASAGEFAKALSEERSAAAPPAPPAGRRRLPLIVGGLGVLLLLVATALLLRPFASPIAPARPADSLAATELAQGNFLLSKRTPAAVMEAIGDFELALGQGRDSAGALAKLGYAYNLFVDWGWTYPGLPPDQLRVKAIEYSNRAIAADSSSGAAWLTRAYVLSIDDPYKMTGAVEAYSRAMALDSSSAEGWYQFGQTLMALGEDARAAAAYRKAFALDPNRPMALMSLSAMSLREGRLAEARRLIDSAVAGSRTVTSPYVRVARGSIALNAGDVRAAHDEADLALAMDTNYTIPARSLLARVYAAEGNQPRAMTEARRLLKDVGTGDLSPTNARYLASALLAVGRPKDAISVLERARPRGAYLWFYMRSLEFRPLMSDPRFLRIYKEADPRS